MNNNETPHTFAFYNMPPASTHPPLTQTQYHKIPFAAMYIQSALVHVSPHWPHLTIAAPERACPQKTATATSAHAPAARLAHDAVC